MRISQQDSLGKKPAEWLFHKAEEAIRDQELEIIQVIALTLARQEEALNIASLLTDIGLFAEHKLWKQSGEVNNFSELLQDIKQQLSNMS